MADRGSEFSFFRGIRIDVFISVWPMTTNVGRQVHLEEFTQMRLIKQVLLTSSHQDHVRNLKKYISTTRVSLATRPGRMVLTLSSFCPYTSPITVPIATKIGRMVTNLKGFLPIKSYDHIITWPWEITWQTENIIS